MYHGTRFAVILGCPGPGAVTLNHHTATTMFDCMYDVLFMK